MRFKEFWENTDIFGFDKEHDKDTSNVKPSAKPLRSFDIELMIEYLLNKRIGQHKPSSKFMNEIQWGQTPGAVRLEVDTGYTFRVKKLGKDLQGNDRWFSKRTFQLNRLGSGGYEDSVANEIFDHMEKVFEQKIDAPIGDFDKFDSLVHNIATKTRRVARDYFIYEGIKKLSDKNYLIVFEVRGGGVEAPGQSRVEENITQISYDSELGVIRATNYNIESPVGGPHSWSLSPVDLDLYFSPSQDREEISEAIAVHMKHY